MVVARFLIKPLLNLYNNRHNKKEHNIKELQLKLLSQLLKSNEKTLIGKYYSFKEIKNTPDDYTKQIPVHTYDDIYNKWWSKSHLNNEQNVFWYEPIKYFALSSGTSGGTTKFLPVSKSTITSMSKTTARMFSQLAVMPLSSSQLTKQVLWVGGSAQLTEENGIYTGDISGINAKFRSSYLTQLFKPEADVTRILSWEDRLELMIERAPDWDIGVLCGIPSWVTLLLEKIVERYELSSIHEIWPNLHTYVSGGIHLEPFKEKLFQLIGKTVTIRDTYLASEGFFAYQYGNHTDLRMKLNLKEYFFEGIPYTGESSLNDFQRCVPCFEFELNKNYALVVTNKGGAWRYLIGDIVQVINKDEMSIKLIGRTSQSLSITGEHLTGIELLKAMNRLNTTLNISPKQFLVVPIIEETKVYHHWYMSIEGYAELESIANTIDLALKRSNDDYKSVRKSGVLGVPVVTIIPDTLFTDWLKSQGKYGNQNKLPLVLNDLQAIKWREFMGQVNCETI